MKVLSLKKNITGSLTEVVMHFVELTLYFLQEIIILTKQRLSPNSFNKLILLQSLSKGKPFNNWLNYNVHEYQVVSKAAHHPIRTVSKPISWTVPKGSNKNNKEVFIYSKKKNNN